MVNIRNVSSVDASGGFQATNPVTSKIDPRAADDPESFERLQEARNNQKTNQVVTSSNKPIKDYPSRFRKLVNTFKRV